MFEKKWQYSIFAQTDLDENAMDKMSDEIRDTLGKENCIEIGFDGTAFMIDAIAPTEHLETAYQIGKVLRGLMRKHDPRIKIDFAIVEYQS